MRGADTSGAALARPRRRMSAVGLRLVSTVIVAGVIAAPLVFAGVAQAATTASITVTNGSGSPVANANVEVFYLGQNLGDSATLPLMSSGATGSNGAYSAAVNTGMVDTTTLGDDGSGADQFNAMVVVSDTNGNYFAVQPEVLTLGGGTSDTVQTATVASLSGVTQTQQTTAAATNGLTMTSASGPSRNG
jgi:hypothetical protein